MVMIFIQPDSYFTIPFFFRSKKTWRVLIWAGKMHKKLHDWNRIYLIAGFFFLVSWVGSSIGYDAGNTYIISLSVCACVCVC